MPLSLKDFTYYKDLAQEDKEAHEEKLTAVNNPTEVINAYNGVFDKFDVGEHAHSKMMIENYLFVGASTILPSLFFQLPRINIRAKREGLDFSAAVLNSLINTDFDERAKEENQLSIIDAFLPYGYGVIKNGYNSRTGKAKNNIFTGKTTGGKSPSNMEGDVEYIAFEKSIGVRQSPKFTYLDSTQPFGKGNRITFKYSRTLQQMIDSNLYALSTNFLSHYGSKAEDKRKVKIDLIEMWIMRGDRAWKLAYVEGWPEEIAWIKSEYDHLPVSYLRFNKMGDILYNISHGTLGLRAQKELNYLNELWKKKVDNLRDQHLLYWDALHEDGKNTIKNNDIGAIVTTNKPITAGVYAPMQSQAINPDLFQNIENTRAYLQLIMSTTGGKGGGPESELATTEKNKALGDALRASGMTDAIRDFVVDQIKQRIKNFVRLGSPEMILKITGENLTNPLTGQPVAPNTEFQIGGIKGLTLNKLVKGNLEVDYIYDVDITSAQRPDFPVIRKQLYEGILLGKQLEPDLNKKGKTIDFDVQLEDYYATFDAVPNAQKYIRDMTEQEKQVWMQNLQAQAAQAAQGGVPDEGSIKKSAEKVPSVTGVGV